MTMTAKRESVYFSKDNILGSAYFSFAEFAAKAAELAAEWGVSVADIQFESSYERGYYDDVDPSIDARVTRMETDEEFAARVEKAKQAAAKARETRKRNAEKKRAEELELLATLKAKYEPGS